MRRAVKTMKKILSLFLACCLCAGPLSAEVQQPAAAKTVVPPETETEKVVPSDPRYLEELKEAVAAEVAKQLDPQKYKVESVEVRYLPQEYLEELQFNARENVYFGHTLSELDALFQGEKYLFTLGDDGKTRVEKFTPYDDSYDRMLKNVAVGAGVIVVCVVVAGVAAVTAGTTSLVFVLAVSAAENAIRAAVMSALVGCLLDGALESWQTRDMEKALKACAMGASEGVKWGAITGAASGGIGKGMVILRNVKKGKPLPKALNNSRKTGPSANPKDLPENIQHEFAWVDLFRSVPKNVSKWVRSCAEKGACKLQTVGGQNAVVRPLSCAEVGTALWATHHAAEQMAPLVLPSGETYGLYPAGKGKEPLFIMLTQEELDSKELSAVRKQWQKMSAAEKENFKTGIAPRFWTDLAKQMCP